jgi:hypothetical protein
MDKHEWLADAQRVPVGQSRRVYHGAESRPNLVVYNNPDCYSAWCHSCQKSGYVPKEVLQRVDTSAPVFHKCLSATDCVTLPELARGHPEKFKRLTLLLHKKHMSGALIAPYSPVYSLTDDRLVFTFKGSSVGRDCTERSHAKWLHYHNTAEPREFLYLQGEITQGTREPVVLVEDLFSAIKVHKYTGLSTLWCKGTHISDAIITFLTYPKRTVELYPVLAFDGDVAGHKAYRTASKRLSIRAVPFTHVVVPDGLDPKDLNHTGLLTLFEGVLNGTD